MPKRDTVQPNVDSIAEKVSAKSWSEASFSKMIGKHKRWLSEVRRGKNLPSPEEAARICQLLKATPDEILLREGETPEATAKCLENIETVRKLVEAEGIKETPDPKIEGVSAEAQEILDYIRDATPAELAEVCRYIGYLKSKRGTE
jgi:transcriptional regulator with XRE-family HTH domain|nr:MAG TPA: Helix-turn-helix XRE-family like protein [Caudoviricetes sp.]